MKPILAALAILSLLPASAGAQDAETVEPPTLVPSRTEAVVYVYASNAVGGDTEYWAFVDERPVGVLRGRQYAGVMVPAGRHVIWVWGGNITARGATLQPGQTYYFRIDRPESDNEARTALAMPDRSEALDDIEGFAFRTLTDEGQERAEGYAAERYSEAVGVAAAGESGNEG